MAVAKKRKRKNSAVRTMKPSRILRANPGPKWHLAEGERWAERAAETLNGPDRNVEVGQAISHAQSVLAASRSTVKEKQRAYAIWDAAKAVMFHRMMKGTRVVDTSIKRLLDNPRRHIPKLRGRGRPTEEKYWRFELYNANGTHLATKSEKTTAQKARVLAEKMRSGTFRRQKIAKVILDGPRSRA